MFKLSHGWVLLMLWQCLHVYLLEQPVCITLGTGVYNWWFHRAKIHHISTLDKDCLLRSVWVVILVRMIAMDLQQWQKIEDGLGCSSCCCWMVSSPHSSPRQSGPPVGQLQFSIFYFFFPIPFGGSIVNVSWWKFVVGGLHPLPLGQLSGQYAGQCSPLESRF